MRVRFITTCALGLAAALSLANTLAAQTTDTTKLRTTSQTRINISKGEVVQPTTRVDTVYVTRYDTVTNTITRVDTVTVTPPAPVVIPKIRGPFYWGLYAGSTFPEGDLDKVYTNGLHGGMVLGWEGRHSPLGLRFDGSVNQLGKEQFGFTGAQQGNSTSLQLQAGADAKLNVIMVRGWNFYGIGGLNGYRYKRIALVSGNDPAGCGTDEFATGDDCFVNANNTEWRNAWGFNVGVGTDFHIGSQDMFIETRALAMQKYGNRTWTIPVSLGVRFF